LANQVKGAISNDRSGTHLSRIPDLFGNLPFFEKEFKLHKYEIEELFLARQAQKQQDEPSGPNLTFIPSV